MRWYWSTMDPEYNVTDVLTKRGSLEADTHGECTHVKTTVMLPQPRNCHCQVFNFLKHGLSELPHLGNSFLLFSAFLLWP